MSTSIALILGLISPTAASSIVSKHGFIGIEQLRLVLGIISQLHVMPRFQHTFAVKVMNNDT